MKKKLINNGDLVDAIDLADEILNVQIIFKDNFFKECKKNITEEKMKNISNKLSYIIKKINIIEREINDKNQEKMFFYDDVKE